MKVALSVIALALIFASCQKDLSVKEESLRSTVSSDAGEPLACHSMSLVTEYPVVPGKVPPFTFTKTLYTNGRVNRINMITRKNFIHQFFAAESIELTGQFSYGPNRAYLKGSRKIWSHYNYGNGVMKKLLKTENVNLKFYITPVGFCERITDLDQSQGVGEAQEKNKLIVQFDNGDRDNAKMLWIHVEDQMPYYGYFYPDYDQQGNVTTVNSPFIDSVQFFTYDYSAPRGSRNLSYVPSQNTISQEFSLLEVMQWVPQSKHLRKSITTSFQLPGNPWKAYQTQKYQNYQFDLSGNMTSATYADNVPIKTTWHCR